MKSHARLYLNLCLEYKQPLAHSLGWLSPTKTDERPDRGGVVVLKCQILLTVCPTACSEERRLALGTLTRMPDFAMPSAFTSQIDNRVEPVPRETCCIQSRAFEQRGLTVLEGSEVGAGVFAKTLVGHISHTQTLDQSRDKIVTTIYHL
ncbi:uncharacterized protein PgNI_11826 [Pyricularia grisea]|uniref:Uncharacterized protein n=1 Tax=Pyricularia grisea TaxID=148305 RepID=A0A6P8ANB7_PYRGI|nr:uncharacterized protein PgNI_11826 [Pyricularia grisea]TLD03515.1 hypothetical protein PgNI_11826 [Pyricularia grisea]